jgi:signal transduction histidine kinase/CheY-like chemotaxis protein
LPQDAEHPIVRPGLSRLAGHVLYLRWTLLWALIIAPITVGLVVTQKRMLDVEANRYCQSRLSNLRHSFERAQTDFRTVSDLVMQQVILPAQCSELLAQAQDDPASADAARAELFTRMKSTYEQLRESGVKQVHFHLPNNHSFLRMHQPGTYGDDLTQVRSTVRLANERRQVIAGFEEGRVFNGFRFVYPLNHRGRHVGTVEISAPSSSLLARIASEMTLVQFVIRREVVCSVVFKEFQKYYRDSELTDDFLIEQNTFVKTSSLLDAVPAAGHAQGLAGLRDHLQHLIGVSSARGVAAAHQLNHEHLMLAYLPVFNVEGQRVAAVLGIERSSVLRGLHQMAQRQMTATVLCSVMVALALTLLSAWASRSRATMRGIAELNRQIEQADQAKSAFLANMSHEIRTPLTAILGYSDVLREQLAADGVQPQRLDALHTICNAGEHLLAIVNDVLDLSKIEAGRMTVEHIEFSLPQALREVQQMMQARIVNKSVKLQARIETPIPERILGDPTRLKQVLMNLLGNSVKFTEAGSVELIASVSGEEPRRILRLEVRDTGAGMSPQHAQKLFRPFTQADGTVTRRFGGTGLGLSISRRLANLMGGNLELVYSREGEGSCFAFTLTLDSVLGAAWVSELAPPPTMPIAASASARPAAAGKLKGHILLAEDSPEIRMLVALHLRHAGAQVTLVENGALALAAINQAQQKQQPFDLLLTDVQMPEMDGHTLARTLRQQGATLPIIALTAYAMGSERQACIDAGCNDYAAKPIDRARLIETVGKWLQSTTRAAVA